MLGIFLDTETNGLNAKKHKILEIAIKILDLSTGELKCAYETPIAISKEDWALSDSISLSINGFKWITSSKGRVISDVAQDIERLFKQFNIKRGQAIYICQNPSFDRIFFSQLFDPDLQEKNHWPYHWLDLASMFWALAMHDAKENGSPYPWVIGCTKDKIAQHFNLGSEESPHRAMNGVNHLIKCYESVVGFPEKDHFLQTPL